MLWRETEAEAEEEVREVVRRDLLDRFAWMSFAEI